MSIQKISQFENQVRLWAAILGVIMKMDNIAGIEDRSRN
jgi:hypothetical protein